MLKCGLRVKVLFQVSACGLDIMKDYSLYLFMYLNKIEVEFGIFLTFFLN